MEFDKTLEQQDLVELDLDKSDTDGQQDLSEEPLSAVLASVTTLVQGTALVDRLMPEALSFSSVHDCYTY